MADLLLLARVPRTRETLAEVVPGHPQSLQGSVFAAAHTPLQVACSTLCLTLWVSDFCLWKQYRR